MKFVLPESILSQHLVILGKTGAGKSSVLRYICEHLLRDNKRVCIVDPKGDHWGIKLDANGRDAGFPLILFGDFKKADATDVPINAHSGAHIAELIASGNRPCVIGFRGWTMADMSRFWIDFAGTLFARNQGELFLVGDEFHNFAPKGQLKGKEGNATMCLHWSNRLLSEGRGLGLTCLLASQRPQKVHNDTLTSCETLVAMRVVHSADRRAVEDWIDGCGDPAKGKEVLNSLAGLPCGAAFVWSPENGFGPVQVKFPLFATFDSFAPPQLQKKVVGSGWAHVDLDAVKTKLSKVIEEAKAKDPAELNKRIHDQARQIRELEAQLKKPAAPAAAEVREQSVLTNEDRKRITKLAETLEKWSDKLALPIRQITEELGTWNAQRHTEIAWLRHVLAPVLQARSQPGRIANSPMRMPAPQVNRTASPGSEPGLGKCERAIISGLHQHGPMSKAKLAVVAGYSVKSSGFDNALGTLRTAGYLNRGNPIELVREPDFYIPQLPTGQELINHWLGMLDKAQGAIFRHLCGIYPGAISKEDLATATSYSARSSGFDNAIGRLRTLGLITPAGQPIAASGDLF